MKPLKVFYVLIVASFIATGFRIYSTFIEQYQKLGLEKTGDAAADKVLEELEQISKLQFDFRTDIVNKVFIGLAIVLLLATLVFIAKKSQNAMVSYFAYLLTMVLFHINHFIFTRNLNLQFEQSAFSSRITLLNFGLAMVIAAVYILLTFISFNRKKSNVT